MAVPAGRPPNPARSASDKDPNGTFLSYWTPIPDRRQ